MNEQADLLLTKIFMRILQRFEEIATIRRVSFYGLSQSTAKTNAAARQTAHSIANDPYFDKMFHDKKGFFDIVGGVDKMASMMAENQISTYKASIDATSIILAHSCVDAAAFDYCKIIEIVSISSWEKFIADVKMPLKEIKGKEYDKILAQKVRKFVASLERESLMYKIDRIFEVCQPPQGFAFITDYEFDKDRLVKLDKLRHEIIHGEGLKKPLENCGDDVHFLRQTAVFLMGPLHERFDVHICPTLLKEDMQRSANLKQKVDP